MEDSVGEEERREQGETVAQAKARQEDEQVEAGGGGEPGEEGGFLSSVASKIGAAMSGANESGGEVNAAAASGGEEERKEEGSNGGGGIFHKLLSSSPAPSPVSGASGTEEVEGEERNQDARGERGGILSAMASKIGMAMSGANGNGNHSTEDDANTSNGDAVDHITAGEEEGDEANGGGILSSMASKIVMAMSGANGDGNRSSQDDAKASNGEAVHGSKGEEKEKGDEENGDGILSTMASKIGMAMSGANGEGSHGGSGDDAKTSYGEAAHGSKGEVKGAEANGGGLVDQIMSNLPSEDQAPDADEASLLIAIIED